MIFGTVVIVQIPLSFNRARINQNFYFTFKDNKTNAIVERTVQVSLNMVADMLVYLASLPFRIVFSGARISVKVMARIVSRVSKKKYTEQ